MTTPNPTPTTREREAARELARQAVDYLDFMAKAGKREGRLHYVGQLIAAALARERREALTEAAEVARAMYDHDHNLRGHGVIFAESIAKAIEAMRE